VGFCEDDYEPSESKHAADFLTTLVILDTMFSRPMFNVILRILGTKRVEMFSKSW
jgi:hypothetical protein